MKATLTIFDKEGLAYHWYQSFIDEVGKRYHQYNDTDEPFLAFFTIKEELLQTYNARYIETQRNKYLEFQSEEDMTLFLLKFS